MRVFTELFSALDETTRTTTKVDAMAAYFATAEPADAAWAIYFLCGRKPRQVVKTSQLRQWASAAAGVPDWLFAESYDSVGDLAETIALLLPAPLTHSDYPLSFWVERVLDLSGMADSQRRHAVEQAWSELDSRQRFLLNKLITGGFRVGVSQLLVVRALARVSGVPAATLSHRLMGDWRPSAAFYQELIAAESTAASSQPYPFFLAHPLEAEPMSLGDPTDWQAEWKWDGIRAQLIRRDKQTFLWSRGEELITERYPELAIPAARLPDGTVLDGELLPWQDGQVRPFADLQKRIGRKTLSKKLLTEVPVVFLAYDLLEHGGNDYRDLPLHDRRSRLESIAASWTDGRLSLSPRLVFSDWTEAGRLRSESRSRGVEGLMLKRLRSPYRVGRVRGDWWKWKVDPLTLDAVLTAAQRGHGKRASLYTDYTFSVWDSGRLVTIAKAYSGLTDAEIREVDRFIRANTLEKFGPVRSVKPELVFELGFEGIQLSTRHKSGIAVRFPRILRQRTDKQAADADTLDRVKQLLAPAAGAP